jgi:selenocysteine lyase/cysteine desulfurase
MKKFFPALNKYKNFYFFNNSAGSQVPNQVIEKVNDYIIDGYSQPFDNNIISKNNKKNIENAKEIVNIITNNNNGKIVFGNSCSQLMFNLSQSIKKTLKKNNNIVIANFNHESCISPFERIARDSDTKIKWWKLTNENDIYNINYNKLLKEIDDETKMVILPHVSNILGNILDIELISKKVKEINKNTKILVDGVAYFPHDNINLYNSNIDYYVFSFYKFCGLRISCLYINNSSFDADINNINHIFFNDEKSNIENKLQIGGINYECLNSINGFQNYLIDFANEFNFNNKKDNIYFDRKMYEFCMSKINIYENIFNKLLNSFLKNENIILLQDKNLKNIPLFSFIFKDYTSSYIVNTLNNLNIIVGGGSFYSNRLIDDLNIDIQDGIVRISLMHYNTFQEVEKLVEILKYFNKKQMDFDFSVTYNLKNKISNIIKNSFNNMKVDNYYSNYRKRGFSLIKVNNDYSLEIINNANFFQSSKYNNFNGDVIRNYNNIDESLIYDETFKELILNFKSEVENYIKHANNYFYVHQIRVYAENNKETNLIPEGIHKDGYNIIGMVCINRQNIEGGVNGIYNNDKRKVHEIQLEEGELLIINDNKLFHDVSNIKKKDKNEIGYRDIFVLTTIS